jgi:signal transduction histidine kinase
MLASVVSTSIYGNTKAHEASIRFAKSIAKVIAFNSQTPLAFDQQTNINEFLDTLKDIDSISHVHIYKVNQFKGKIEYFTSYKSEGLLPISSQSERVSSIYQPVYKNSYIEYALPVKDSTNLDILGYVYLRIETANFEDTLVDLMAYNVVLAAALAGLAFFISILLRRRVLNPINDFVKDIQQITENKDYRHQVQDAPLIELSALVESINSMLSKINQQIAKFAEAEKEITELNHSLEEKVVTRTQALRDSNQELLDALEQVHQYQSQVIQSEKMASLGQMVAGVAHEVNTPIGLGVTASTMLSDRIDEIQQALDSKSLSAKKLEKFLADSKENTQIIYRNLSRAADLISSFKQVAVDQTADNARMVNLRSFVQEVITSLHPTLKKSHHNIEVDCEENLEILTKPGPINQVIINLIMNSIIHGFDEQEEGTIKLKIWTENLRCHIDYSDDGKGIEEKIKQKIFDPFVTTRRGEGGSGLGMHLVYNLVTQALNGTIDVESQLGEGATFRIEFPISELKK